MLFPNIICCPKLYINVIKLFKEFLCFYEHTNIFMDYTILLKGKKTR